MTTESEQLSPRRFHGDAGASLVEYGLLIALILVVCVGVLVTFGDETDGLTNGSASQIQSASN
jgi:Flp pilus assembly pilin Flp